MASSSTLLQIAGTSSSRTTTFLSCCWLVLLGIITRSPTVSAYATQPTAGMAPRSFLPKSRDDVSLTGGAATLTSTAAVTSTAPWRIALNIGNRPGYFSSTSWPIVFKCDFSDQQNRVLPHDDTIRYTTKTGEVRKPIESGEWSLEPSKNRSQKLTFTVNFPEEMSRNGETVKAGTLTCEGLLYTQEDLKVLNENFYKARDKTWELGGQLNAINQQRNGPKKWNEEKQRWEEPSAMEPLWSYLQKQIQYKKLKAEQQKENEKRPDPKRLSSYSGPFPGMDPDQRVFIGNMGIIKQGMTVLGTWAAEPINEDRPVSYMGN